MVAQKVEQEVARHHFTGFGAHHSSYPCCYLTAAAAVGITREDVDSFIRRLDKVLGYRKRGRPSTKCELPASYDIKEPNESDCLDDNLLTPATTRNVENLTPAESASFSNPLTPPSLVFGSIGASRDSCSSSDIANEAGAATSDVVSST